MALVMGLAQLDTPFALGRSVLLGTFLLSQQRVCQLLWQSNDTRSALITSTLLCDLLTDAVSQANHEVNWSARNLSSPAAMEVLLCFPSTQLCNMRHGLLISLLFWFNLVLLLFLVVSHQLDISLVKLLDQLLTSAL